MSALRPVPCSRTASPASSTSTSITSELIGGLRADLGVIAPRVRVVVGGSYFKGSFKPDRIARFERRLQEVLLGHPGGPYFEDKDMEYPRQYARPNLQIG